ncbi:MAG: hypothetical protein ACTFAL_00395 [Candidatus Electronema sp. V4]|uniref:hypothetical protein n=1 Tax=Candidatus Electronema sp. V4 TaxID=3454756 RepID=UPI0040556FC8
MIEFILEGAKVGVNFSATDRAGRELRDFVPQFAAGLGIAHGAFSEWLDLFALFLVCWIIAIEINGPEKTILSYSG